MFHNKNVPGYQHSKAPDFLYYNIDIVNNKTTDDSNVTELKYLDSRDVPIIHDASNYYFSIIRYQMNGLGESIPLIIPQIELNQTDENKLVYKVSMRYEYQYNNSVTKYINKTVNLTFISQNKNYPAPTSNTPITKQIISPYYYVHTYNHFLKIVNNAFETVNNEILAQIRADESDANIVGPNQARIVFNPSSELFTIYLDDSFYGKTDDAFVDTSGNQVDIHCRLFFDSNLFGLFNSFHHNYMGGDTANHNSLSVDNLTYEILPIKDGLGLNTFTYNSNTYWKIEQGFTSLSDLWCPISSIVFTSSTLPIIPEIAGTPLEFSDSSTVTTATTRSNYQKIITDLILPVSKPSDYKQTITYFGGNNQWRLSEMTKSSVDIRMIDFNVFCRLKSTGELLPLTLYNAASVSLKIAFIHKKLKGY